MVLGIDVLRILPEHIRIMYAVSRLRFATVYCAGCTLI